MAAMKTQQDIRREIVGKFLRKKREAADKTQWDIAKTLDYTSAQFVSNWERGIALPPQDSRDLRSIARLIGCEPAELIDRMQRCEEKETELKYGQIRRGVK